MHTPDQDPPKDGALGRREALDSRWGAAMRGVVKNREGARPLEMKLNNLAGRVGAWAAANPKDAIFGWIAFVAIAVALGAHFGTKAMPQRESTMGESAQADQTLSRVGLRTPAEEAVLVQITRLNTPTVELYKAVRDATDKLQSIDDVRKLRSPLDPQNPDLLAWDLRSALITFRVRGNPDKA